MQNSTNKSQQLNYSHCKLSPILFYPETIQRERNDVFNLDNRSRIAFLQSSMLSGKMGIIEPNLGNYYYNKLKNLSTPYAEDSILNSKKSGKESSRRKDENSVKKTIQTFEHQWNTRNIKFNSNEDFKSVVNLPPKVNRPSAFQLEKTLGEAKKISSAEGRQSTESNRNNYAKNQVKSSVLNNTNNIRPQVFSSILKVTKDENVTPINAQFDDYGNNLDYKFKSFKNEKLGNNNLNLTIINNNNFNLKNVITNERVRGRKGQNNKQAQKNKRNEHLKNPSNTTERNYNEWRLQSRNNMIDGVKDDHNAKRGRDTTKQNGKNWKKVIEICKEANEYSNNIYNAKLLNKKRSRVNDTPISSAYSKNFDDSCDVRLNQLEFDNEEKISTNIITKRIIINEKQKKNSDDSTYILDEVNRHQCENSAEKRLFKSENKRKLKRFKKSENINIILEKTEKNLQVNYKYLFEPFEENPEIYSSCNFINDDLKKEYTHYLTYGKSNEQNISFGDSPLTIYQNLAEWFNREIQKNNQNTKNFKPKDSLKLCEKIIYEMNDISRCISSLPIFMFPATNKSKLSQKPIKNKNRRKFDESGPVFSCEVCNQKFNCGQGLGGHMSRKHPKASVKFIRKKEIRNKREEHRNILYEAKKKLLASFNYNYDQLRSTSEGKKQIKEIVKSNRDTFKSLRMEISKMRKKERKSEDKRNNMTSWK